MSVDSIDAPDNEDVRPTTAARDPRATDWTWHELPLPDEIRDRADLMTYLQCAIELEHTTLPAYATWPPISANGRCSTATPSRQLTPAFSYGGSGRIVAVTDLSSALAALEEIVEQGEGTSALDVWDGDRDMFHPERGEVGHFYRIEELRRGRRFQPGDTPQSGPRGDPIAIDPTGVWPMQPNPSPAASEPARSAQHDFDVAYCELLAALDDAFNGDIAGLGPAVGAMYGLKARAQELMRTAVAADGSTAGPTFRYVSVADRSIGGPTLGP